MMISIRTDSILGFVLILTLAGCSLSSHPVARATLGKTSGSTEMERLIDQPGPIELTTISSADWQAPLSGLLNLESAAATQAGLTDRDEPIEIFAHVLKNPQYGNYLVDTGFSQKLLDDPGKEGLNWMLRKVMKLDKIRIKQSTGAIVQGLNGRLDGVLFTHLHLDHISGLPDIPQDAPLYIGATESTATSFLSLFVRGASDQLLENKHTLQEWHFAPDPQQAFAGVIDVFSDGSLFAISVPGHTPGSVAYLVRTPRGPVLLTGDTCHTRWGWEHTVEPGDFTEDHERNLINLKRLKALVDRHPTIAVRLGHQQ